MDETDKPDIELFADEKLIKKIQPHPFAFYDMYLIWVWVILLSLAFMFYGDELSRFANNPVQYMSMGAKYITTPSQGKFFNMIPFYTSTMQSMNNKVDSVTGYVNSYTPVGLWIIALVISSLLISVFKIEFKWLALMVGTGIISLILSVYQDLNPKATYVIAIVLSALAIVLVDYYRKCHCFYITDARIITTVSFAGKKRNELSYDKINNVVMEQSFIGSVLGFGTIIPVTASGLGMGSDFSSVSVGTQGNIGKIPLNAQVTGGRAIQVPRVKSMYALFGVTEPETIQQILIKYVHNYVEAPYLKKMTEQLDDIRYDSRLMSLAEKVKKLEEEKDSLNKVNEVARDKFHKREIDEENLRQIVLENQKKIINLEIKLEKLKENDSEKK